MVTAQVEMITPEKAMEYLERNTANYRKLSMAKVLPMAEDMRKGRWQLNGETIVFGMNGTLKDGQHRLKAIVESGVTVPVLVAREVDDNVDIFDCGGGRTIQQWGSAKGQPLSTQAAAIAGIVVRGFRGNAPRGVLQGYIDRHIDDLREAVRIASLGKSKPIGRKGSIALCVYIARRFNLLNDDSLEAFFRIFNTGVSDPSVTNSSPAQISSRQIMTKIIGGGAGAQEKQVCVILQALMDFRKGRSRKNDYPHNPKMLDYVTEIRKQEGFLK